MLLHSGVPMQDIEVFNVMIDNQRNYIRTVRVGSHQNPAMLLIHGYGGSSQMFLGWVEVADLNLPLKTLRRQMTIQLYGLNSGGSHLSYNLLFWLGIHLEVISVIMRRGSSEYCIFRCFNHELFAFHPLNSDDRLGKIKIPVSIYYGDTDWMRKDGAEDIINQNPYKGTQSHIFTISESNHQMFFDNPAELVKIMIQDLSNLDNLDCSENDIEGQDHILHLKLDKRRYSEHQQLNQECLKNHISREICFDDILSNRV
ncbi:UNKNOWN [Stylonychia lemnae]|uniref:Uncharacterized protein n=1 Tax=Stylonychia lemnae TaxID=5949 RepID=A0A078ARR0_STYLE|nr:UNKNOWN [Stylonychia lemnae]|eukprot:CDW84874.1 UNKNOWN [Stylonychia lemnae]